MNGEWKNNKGYVRLASRDNGRAVNCVDYHVGQKCRQITSDSLSNGRIMNVTIGGMTTYLFPGHVT